MHFRTFVMAALIVDWSGICTAQEAVPPASSSTPSLPLPPEIKAAQAPDATALGSVLNPVLPKLLGVGDPAPSLEGLQVVKGEALTSFAQGTIYLVDFWATWCGPCIKSMPHLSDLAERYKDKGVKVVGVSIWETEKLSQGTLIDRVRSFVDKSELIRYPVSYGGDDGELARRWMNGSGRTTIPTVFVIDKQGKIAWIGHPMIGLDEALEKIVSGTYDPVEEQRLATERENRRIIGMRMATRLQQRVQAKDWEAAIEISDNLIDLDSQIFSPAGVSKMRILTHELKDAARANEWAKVAMDKAYSNNAFVLREISHLIITAPEGFVRDTALALSLAQRAATISKPDDTRSFQLLAQAQAGAGDPVGARATLEKASEHASEMAKEEIRAELEKLK